MLAERFLYDDTLSEFEQTYVLNNDMKLAALWAHNFNDAVQVLSTQERKAPWPYFAMFWIQLWDVLVGLRLPHEKAVEFGHDLPSESPTFPMVVAQGQVVAAVDALRNQLSRDELVYVDLMRHTYAHVYQTSFKIQLKSKGMPKGYTGFKEDKKVKPLGERMEITAITEAVDRVLDTGHGCDGDIAVALAKRLRPFVPPLLAPLKTLANFQVTPEAAEAWARVREATAASDEE